MGFTGVILAMTTPLSFPSDRIGNCSVSIASCDTTFTQFLGADITYDHISIPNTGFLVEKFFSCVKCTGNLIPTAYLHHDPSKKAFFYKSYQNMNGVEGNSVTCVDPIVIANFGLAPGTTGFDLDPNCALIVHDRSKAQIPQTKLITR